MNPDEKGSCKEFSSLLVRKISGEIPAHEKRVLESHLAQCPSCAKEELDLTAVWQKFDSLPNPNIPAEVYENTRRMMIAHLQQEKRRSAWFTMPIAGPWGLVVPLAAGLAMTAVSYGLIHRFIDPSIHHHYVLLPLFSLWWMLFATGFWLILKGKRQRTLSLDLVSASSISIALLTLFIAFVSYELELSRWLMMSVSYEVAAVSNYLFGIGNTFVTAWWVHCCLASFIGAFIFGVSASSRSSANLFMASFVVMILLSPAIYLQGAFHNHGVGIIAFAAAGAYVGTLVGMGLGIFIRRQLSFQFA